MTELIIELINLKNNTNWNGFKGTVIDYITKENRFIVKLTENKVVKVKPINIFLDNETKMIEYPKPESSVFVFNGPTIFRVGTSNKTSNNKRKSRTVPRKNKKKWYLKPNVVFVWKLWTAMLHWIADTKCAQLVLPNTRAKIILVHIVESRLHQKLIKKKKCLFK